MKKEEILKHLDAVGFTPQEFYEQRLNWKQNVNAILPNQISDLEKLNSLYGNKSSEIKSLLEKLAENISTLNQKEFTVQELFVSELGEGYGEEIAIIIYIPEFNVILKSTAEYYSYSGVDKFRPWSVLDLSNGIKIKYAE